LIGRLHERRCLLVLDNLETLLEVDDPEGNYRAGYEGYGRLLERLGEAAHRSCVVLTSREKPREIEALEGLRGPVRSLRLSGLSQEAARSLLSDKDLRGESSAWLQLIASYAGNPLALKIVGQAIVDLFAGDIVPFLHSGELIFNGIRVVLRQQVARLTPLEQTLLTWLAVVREWTSLETLLSLLVKRPTRARVLEALEALWRRSLIERGEGASFTLQSVVMEYVTDALLDHLSEEIRTMALDHLHRYALEQAHAKDYVRAIQVRLLVRPLLERLRAELGADGLVETHLLRLLEQFRAEDTATQGYGPANVLSLLKELRGHLRGLDLSQLSIRGASLQGVEMQDASLAGATLRDSTFTETFDATWSVGISGNGTYWAVGSERGEVCVWREGGKLLHLAWQAHTNTVKSLAFSPDERTLATSSWDGAIKLWDLERGALLWTDWQTSSIQRLAFAPDGRTLASASWDQTVKLWDVESHRLRETLTGHTDKVLAVVWSPDGHLVASCGLDRTIWLWDVERSSYRTTLHGHTAGVYAIAFTPDNRSLLSGSEDGTVRVWDAERGQCVQIMQGYAVSVYDVAWSPDGTHLASAGTDLLVTMWDVAASTPPRALRGHSWNVYGVTWSPDGLRLASSGWDNAIRVWDANAAESRQTLRDPDYVDTLFYGVAWSPDGKFLATGSYQRGVQVWEMTTSNRRWVGRGQPTKIRRVAWSPDSSQLASCGDDGSICLWKASDGLLLAKLQEHRGIVASVAWSSDGARLASCGGGMGSGELFVWDARSGERLYTWSEPSEIVYALTWSRSGTMLVSGGSDGRLRWWDLQSGECVRVRKAHQGAIQSLRSSPDGQRLASCGDDGAINVWEWESGEHLRTLQQDRPYERLDISGVQGLTDAQRATLRALGAIEEGRVARL
jgi:WD40 repeat protein